MYQLPKFIMNHKPAWLEEEEIVLPDGTTAVWSYDTEGDLLEIFFNNAPASATLELADGVFLRFDRQQQRPLSLGFVAASTFMNQTEFGPSLLSLTGLTKLPDSERQLILHLLQTSPLNLILHLYSFKPTTRARAIPVASLAQSIPMAA